MKWVGSLNATFNALGVGFALLLAFLAFLLLPTGERRLARASFFLLFAHVVLRFAERALPPAAFSARVFAFLALFALFASMAKSGFLLAVRSIFARRLTRPWPRIVHDLLQGMVYFAVALLALSAIGVEPGSLLTTSALLTAVIGLSLQDTLGNLFAGLALQAQPPFSVGDWIRYAEGPNGIGRVIEINWRATHLVTVSEVEVIVPNGVMAKSPLYNYSRPARATRCDTRVTLPASLAPETVRRLCARALENVPAVLTVPPATVTLGEFGERGVEYSVRYFIEEFGQRDVIESDVRQRLWYVLERERIQIPAPRRRIEPVRPEEDEERTARGARDVRARLAHVGFLSGASAELLDCAARGTRLVLYAAGEAIVRQGDSGDELFVIERGTVDVFVSSGAVAERRVASLGPGQTFGEAALLQGTQRTATVVAASECELLVITAAAFRGAAELDSSLESRLAHGLAQRMAELSKAVSPSEPGGEEIDEERRSDLLIMRIKQFFRR
jgi:small-conductance mechanosensitive channel/CRP-like cAMP-binding protein